MAIIESLFVNFQDFFDLGFEFPVRHALAALSGAKFRAHLRAGEVVTLRSRGSDTKVIRQVFAKKDYDLTRYPQFKWVQQAYEDILSAGKVPIIVDAGANIGASTIWFARQFPRARVIAVEPEPHNAALCRANIAAHPNATLVEAALGGAPGAVALSVGSEDWAFQTARAETGGVALRTMGELLASTPHGQAFIIKMDIEGFESDVFEGNVDWLDEVTAFIVEPHDWMLPGAGSSWGLQRALGARKLDLLLSGENLIYVRPPKTQ